MMKNDARYDIVALGELLIDLVQCGRSTQDNPLLEANPGGAPCNVLALLARLGHPAAFIGKVGQDGFGNQLEAALREVGIDPRGLRRDKAATTLAVVTTQPDGDRAFSFYRTPGADTLLRADELDEELLTGCRIFHYGTLSMTADPCRTATRTAVEAAKAAGALLSFDPNLRESLWNDLEDARAAVAWGLEHCDILKISDNELQWFTGKEDFDEGMALLRAKYPIPLIVLSLGKTGSRAYCGEVRVEMPGFKMENTIETTGAGDTFMGGILHGVLTRGWRGYTAEELAEMLRFANAAAAIVTTRRGALRVMPTREEIDALLARG